MSEVAHQILSHCSVDLRRRHLHRLPHLPSRSFHLDPPPSALDPSLRRPATPYLLPPSLRLASLALDHLLLRLAFSFAPLLILPGAGYLHQGPPRPMSEVAHQILSHCSVDLRRRHLHRLPHLPSRSFHLDPPPSALDPSLRRPATPYLLPPSLRLASLALDHLLLRLAFSFAPLLIQPGAGYLHQGPPRPMSEVAHQILSHCSVDLRR